MEIMGVRDATDKNCIKTGTKKKKKTNIDNLKVKPLFCGETKVTNYFREQSKIVNKSRKSHQK